MSIRIHGVTVGGPQQVDSELSSESVNPVQNKVVTSALANKQNTIGSDSKLPYEYISGAPAVGSATLTITQGGVSKGTFGANATSDVTIALDAGLSTVTWGAISGTLSDQADLNSALGAKQDKIDSDHKLPYSNLSDTPTIGSGVYTIMQGGVSKGTIDVNATSNASISLDGAGISSVTWGGITGDISSQADLSSALGAKQDVIDASHKLPYSNISDTPTIGSGVLSIVSSGTTVTFGANQTANSTVTIPTMPTVGSGVYTIMQGGVSKGEINVNAVSGGSISLDAGGSAGSVEWGGISGTLSSQADLSSALASKVDTAVVGSSNGVASLDSAGKVPSGQLPDLAPAPIVLSSSGEAPTSNTVGANGQRAVNTANYKAWTCFGNAGTEQNPEYMWFDDINAIGGNIYMPINVQNGNVVLGDYNGTYLSVKGDYGTSLMAGRPIGQNYGFVQIGNSNGYAQVDVYPNNYMNVHGLTLATGYENAVTTIPAATTAYTLSEGAFGHAPTSAPTYTLPAVTDATRTHSILLDVDFTTVQSIAFQDSSGNAVALQKNISITAGDQWRFICTYTYGSWRIFPVPLNGGGASPSPSGGGLTAAQARHIALIYG